MGIIHKNKYRFPVDLSWPTLRITAQFQLRHILCQENVDIYFFLISFARLVRQCPIVQAFLPSDLTPIRPNSKI